MSSIKPEINPGWKKNLHHPGLCNTDFLLSPAVRGESYKSYRNGHVIQERRNALLPENRKNIVKNGIKIRQKTWGKSDLSSMRLYGLMRKIV